MRLIALAAAALIAILALVALPAAAAENPLTGKRTTEQQSPKPAAAPESSGGTTWLGDIGRAVFDLQRRANRAIATHMRTIRDGTTATPLLIGLLLALAYGAVHALGPGHGKFIVVTYFMAKRARVWRGIWMGAQIAVFHVVAAIVMVYLADLVLRSVFGGTPAELQAVRIASYGLIAVIGAVMLVQAARRSLGLAAAHRHDHGHDDGHGHHTHADSRQITLLSLTVGLVPCTGAVLVLLYAIANDILVAGYLMVAAISIGMAGTLAVLGIASILFRRAVEAGLARRSDRPSRLAQGFDLAGALAITAIGLLLLAGTIWPPVP